ncbi:SseB family protein [Microbacterium sp. STN6]|uniref:SseB family protein n=1 Tax=Microbacterium sp. STN6 TaxID=2995588 RepID=UPI0022609DAC|nr:SseB family protein [Microbacterium sp. STN6]MCX7522680.1 SseB family protein [Microbacterium sp. STN6]
MKATPRFPASYVNTGVERALAALAAAPSEQTLSALLDAATKGGLVLDITGSSAETGTHVRTVASTDGKQVLPLFTSMKELQRAVAETAEEGMQVQATIVPSRQALELIRTDDDFVAVQFNPGPDALVVARAHVEAAL